MMNQAEEAKLLEQIEEWNDADEFSRCIEAIEATEQSSLRSLRRKDDTGYQIPWPPTLAM